MRGAPRIQFDEAALIADLERESIERVAPRHGMTSRTLARRLRENPRLRAAAKRRPIRRDRTGEIYGRWQILRFSRTTRFDRYWWALCLDCGTEHEVRIGNLQLGRSSRCLSCACKLRERLKREAREVRAV